MIYKSIPGCLIGKGGTGTNIAVLDTGSNDHPTLDFTRTTPRDVVGHGSEMCRIISKMAPAAEVQCLKVIAGRTKGCRAIIKALEYLKDNPVDVVNMSFALTSEHDEISGAIDDVLESSPNTIFVAASNPQMIFPGCHADVISTTSQDDHKADVTIPVPMCLAHKSRPSHSSATLAGIALLAKETDILINQRGLLNLLAHGDLQQSPFDPA